MIKNFDMAKKNDNKKNNQQLSINFDNVENNSIKTPSCHVKVISFNEKIKENKIIIRDNIFKEILNNSKSF
jgi:hypothetical protein